MKTCNVCHAPKPLTEFHKVWKGKEPTQNHCKACSKAKTTQYRQDNPQVIAAILRNSFLKRTYGITSKDYDRMVAEQGGVCAICGSDFDGRRLEVDHDHITGRVRALLCGRCNSGLASFENNRHMFEAYLRYLAVYN